MLPHPSTMQFVWEEQVLRCSRYLLLAFALGIVALVGGLAVVEHAQDASLAAVEEPAASAAAFPVSGSGARR